MLLLLKNYKHYEVSWDGGWLPVCQLVLLEMLPTRKEILLVYHGQEAVNSLPGGGYLTESCGSNFNHSCSRMFGSSWFGPVVHGDVALVQSGLLAGAQGCECESCILFCKATLPLLWLAKGGVGGTLP